MMTDKERIAELERCLRPFVEVGVAYMHSNMQDESALWRAPVGSPKSLKVDAADLRRAIKVLSGMKGK